jgi:hypothetical protein
MSACRLRARPAPARSSPPPEPSARPQRTASLSGPGALRRLMILNLDGSFCTRCAAPRAARVWRPASPADALAAVHGPLRDLSSMDGRGAGCIGWRGSSAQSRSLVSTVDARLGGEMERPRDSFRLRGSSCVLSITSSLPTLTLCYIRELHPPFSLALHLPPSLFTPRSQKAPQPTRGRASAAQPHPSALIRLRAAVLSWLEWMRARGALGPSGDWPMFPPPPPPSDAYHPTLTQSSAYSTPRTKRTLPAAGSASAGCGPAGPYALCDERCAGGSAELRARPPL